VVVVLPVPLTPTMRMTSGGGGRVLDGVGYAVEDLAQLGLEDLLELGPALDAGAQGALAEVLHDDGSGGAADVGGEQAWLKLVERGLVDLAGERDDGADGL